MLGLSLLIAVYWVLATAVLVASGRNEKIARLLTLSTAFIDIKR